MAGRGLMTAGAIVTIVGLGIVLMKTLHLPAYWTPVIVGVALFVAGAIVWAMAKERKEGA
jgi:glucose uptake protein GlcU